MANTRGLARNKRIVVCCDGTWLASDLGDKSVPSNVAKLARAVAPSGLDEGGRLIKQIVFYQSGLGSGDLLGQKAIYGGLGLGLDTDVTQAYEFITDNYEPGDELFFFGFSRGAFTARSVAGLISNVGVLSSCNMIKFPELWKAYRENTGGESFQDSPWYVQNAHLLGLTIAPIKVVGVWETVGALGIPEWPLVGKLEALGFPINKAFAFHDTKVSKNIDYAFQALSIDEKRLTFPPTIWHSVLGGPAVEMKQCWFPGVHSNIGGQSETFPSLGDHEEIGDNTFAWMVDNISNMLTFEESSIEDIVEHHQRSMQTNQRENEIPNGWGCGNIVDNFAVIPLEDRGHASILAAILQSLIGFFFRLLGQKIRTPGGYTLDPGDGFEGVTNETIHPMVRIRVNKVRTWNPPALKGFHLDNPDGQGSPWGWRKFGARRLPEYIMLPEKTTSVSYLEGNEVKYKSAQSMSRRLCPTRILLALDEANNIVAKDEDVKGFEKPVNGSEHATNGSGHPANGSVNGSKHSTNGFKLSSNGSENQVILA